MTSVQTTTIQAAAPTTAKKVRHERSVDETDYGSFYAHFAQHSSLGTARNGSLALQVGQAGGGGVSRRSAQQLQYREADSAQARSGLRDQPRGALGESRERLSDRLARTGRARGVPAQQGDRIGEVVRETQDATTTDRVGNRPGALSSGQSARAQAGDGGAPGTNADAQIEGNHALVAPGGGASQSRVSQGSTASNIAVSSIKTGIQVGPSSQHGTNASIFADGQSGQQRTKAAASQRSAQAPAPTPEQTTAFRAQVARGLGAALRSGQGQVTLKLRPSTLGELQVRVQIKGSTVDAQIRPSTIEAHRLLEQSVGALRHSFEARGLQVGRIEIEQPPASKEGSGGATHQHQPGSQDDQFGMGRESEEHLSKDSTAGRATHGAGGIDSRTNEAENVVMPEGYGNPGIVYSVADGAARIVMIDALA